RPDFAPAQADRARSVDAAFHPDRVGLRLRVRARRGDSVRWGFLSVTLWPRSLFGRLALLLLLVILVSQATAIYLFRQDRATLLARQFSDTKLVQLHSLRAALAATDPRAADATLARFGEEYHARIVPDQERRFVGIPPQNPLLIDLERRLQAELGPETELRIQP